MAVEEARGCGYRKVGGLYLVGGGANLNCDRLPYKIENCPVCGSGLKFSRGFTWLDWLMYAGSHGGSCKCPPNCPICYPVEPDMPYALIWIGDRYYTPEEFVKESLQQGISRRLPNPGGKIPRGPRGLKLGETWVLCAHIKACGEEKDPETGNTVNIPGIFYAYRPTRLEYLLWEKDANKERLEELTKAGITPVVIPDGDKDHDPVTPLGLDKDEKAKHENKLFFTDLRSKLKRSACTNNYPTMPGK